MRNNEESVKPRLQKLKFEDGSYINYTILTKKEFSFSVPIITISGVPSFIYEWEQLEKNTKSSHWINFFIPGYDGEDERRSSHKGSLKDTSLLIKNLMDHFKIPKAVFLVHSFGYMLLNIFIKYFPERVAGIALLGSFSIISHPYPLFSFDILKSCYPEIFRQGNEKKLLDGILNNDEVRDKIWSSDSERKKYSSAINFYTKLELIVWIKQLLGEQQFEEVFQVSQEELPKHLKLLVNGKNDIFITSNLSELGFDYFINKGNTQQQNLNDYQKQYIQKKFGQFVNLEQLNLENLQQNFVYLINGGHSVHNSNAKEINKLLWEFQAIIEAMQFQKPQL